MNAIKRDLKEKTRAVLKNDYIPANLCKVGETNSTPIKIYKTDFRRFLDAGGNKSNVELIIDGEVYNCSIEDYQIDALKECFTHIDF